MGKITWDQAVKNGMFAYYHRDKYAYFYGAKGQVLTDELMDYFISAEPAHFKKFSKEELKAVKDFSRGKIGLDCSAFTGWICTGDKQYSAGQIANCSKTTTDLVAGVAGRILYTTFGGTGRHIAIDIGYGYFLHCPSEGHTIELGKILDYPWEISGQSNCVDYSGDNNR